MSPFLRAYFSRLGWTGEPDVSIDTLRELHLQHNSAIPFENLDVLLPREIHLDDRALEDKLIAARRGGYCFEQNGLLERVLREIGFNVRSLLGRVVLANASDYVMGNFWSAHWPQSHFRHHLLMCRHLPDGGKMTLTNFHFTHWENNHVVEKIDFADVSALYEALQTRFGLGVDDPKHGFSEAALAAVMAAFDTHPEAGK